MGIFQSNLVKNGEKAADKVSKMHGKSWRKCIFVFCIQRGKVLKGDEWPIIYYRNSVVQPNDFYKCPQEIEDLYWNSRDTMTLSKFCRTKGYDVKGFDEKNFICFLINFENTS